MTKIDQTHMISKTLLSTQSIDHMDNESLLCIFNVVRSKALSDAVYPHLCGHLELLRTIDDSTYHFPKDSPAR